MSFAGDAEDAHLKDVDADVVEKDVLQHSQFLEIRERLLLRISRRGWIVVYFSIL